MAEYRRFISYIYSYEGDKKTKNVGFAKIEARNGQCRISVSIRGAYECSGQGLTLYGYGYREAGCLLVPLGQVPVKNGTGEAVFGRQEENLGGSGYGLRFIKGLYLRSRVSVQRSYLTTWDDTVIQISALRNAKIAGREADLQAASLPEEKGTAVLTGMEAFRPAEGAAKTPMKVELLQPELLRSVLLEATEPDLSQPSASQPSASQPSISQPSASQSSISQPSASQPSISQSSASEPHGQSGQKPSGGDEEKGEREPKTPERGMSAEGEETEAPEAEGAMRETAETEQEAARAAKEGDQGRQEAAAAAAGRMPEHFYFREGFTELPLWECLERILPRKRVLAEEGWEVLQIHVQDIGRLPRENWPYGNNSFVLHGYFQYRYLILARRKRAQAKKFQSGYQYILGVPGIFKPQEKFMASMFGLPEFKRAAGNRKEDFGFWCGTLQM